MAVAFIAGEIKYCQCLCPWYLNIRMLKIRTVAVMHIFHFIIPTIIVMVQERTSCRNGVAHIFIIPRELTWKSRPQGYVIDICYFSFALDNTGHIPASHNIGPGTRSGIRSSSRYKLSYVVSSSLFKDLTLSICVPSKEINDFKPGRTIREEKPTINELPNITSQKRFNSSSVNNEVLPP